MTLSKKAAPATWRDERFCVRPATPYELHTNPSMPWAIVPLGGKKAKRHAPTEAEAIAIAQHLSTVAERQPKKNRVEGTPTEPPASTSQVEPEPFRTTHFECIHANPYASVWMCTSYIGDKGQPGRKRADGRPNEQTVFRHLKGDCSILIGREPQRDRNGKVIIWSAGKHHDAREEADRLYQEAYHERDDVIWWNPNQKYVVDRSMNFEVCYDPESHGYKNPFVLWNSRANRPVFVNKTRPLMSADNHRHRVSKNVNPQLHLQIEEARKRRQSEERVAMLSEEPLRFRSPWEATAKMMELERTHYPM